MTLLHRLDSAQCTRRSAAWTSAAPGVVSEAPPRGKGDNLSARSRHDNVAIIRPGSEVAVRTGIQAEGFLGCEFASSHSAESGPTLSSGGGGGGDGQTYRPTTERKRERKVNYAGQTTIEEPSGRTAKAKEQTHASTATICLPVLVSTDLEPRSYTVRPLRRRRRPLRSLAPVRPSVQLSVWLRLDVFVRPSPLPCAALSLCDLRLLRR